MLEQLEQLIDDGDELAAINWINENKINLNSNFSSGLSILSYAALNTSSSLLLVTYLLNQPSVDINQVGLSKKVALHDVVGLAKPELLKLFLTHPKIQLDNNDSGISPFERLCEIIQTTKKSSLGANSPRQRAAKRKLPLLQQCHNLLYEPTIKQAIQNQNTKLLTRLLDNLDLYSSYRFTTGEERDISLKDYANSQGKTAVVNMLDQRRNTLGSSSINNLLSQKTLINQVNQTQQKLQNLQLAEQQEQTDAINENLANLKQIVVN